MGEEPYFMSHRTISHLLMSFCSCRFISLNILSLNPHISFNEKAKSFILQLTAIFCDDSFVFKGVSGI